MKPTTQHMIGVLKATIRALGFTNREIEIRLNVSRGYLTRLFSGVMELRFDHVAEIAEILGVEPEELFRLAFPPSRKPVEPAVSRLREVLGVPPEPAEPAASEIPPESLALQQALEKMVARTIQTMLSKLQS
jgi:transcriptional regulator with XRE-family HTH domain